MKDEPCSHCSGKKYVFGLGEYCCPACGGSGRNADYMARLLSGEVPQPMPKTQWEWRKWAAGDWTE